jgi:hypothetical protein
VTRLAAPAAVSQPDATPPPNSPTPKDTATTATGQCDVAFPLVDGAKLVTDSDKTSHVVEPNGSEAHIDIDVIAQSTVYAPPRNTIRPNQGIIVRVCHARSDTVEVSVGGTRGTSTPATNNATTVTPAAATPPTGSDGGTPQVTTAEDVVSVWHFAPRQPGSADVTVTTTPAGGKATTYKTELEVDTLYWGAVRIGVGTLFGNWNGYAITTFAGSSQPEIQSQRTAVAFEFVAGFAPYLFDLIGCTGHGGRSESGGCDGYVAPYFGFGLVGASTTGVQALSSIHMGFEFEFAPNFSVATDFVVRRTPGLAQGYQLGSPVALTTTIDDVTRATWQPGFALVINASPSFFNFQVPSGGSGTSAGSNGKK